jgi:hypothetical protein
MNARRVLILLGSLWDLARFFLTLSIVAAIFGSEGGWAAALLPWLLVASASCLLVPAAGFLLALYPGRYGNLAAFLALGKILNLFSFILLLLAGPLAMGARTALLRLGEVELTPLAVLPAVALFDLIFFIILVSFRMGLHVEAESAGAVPRDAAALPENTEAKIEDYH